MWLFTATSLCGWPVTQPLKRLPGAGYAVRLAVFGRVRDVDNSVVRCPHFVRKTAKSKGFRAEELRQVGSNCVHSSDSDGILLPRQFERQRNSLAECRDRRDFLTMNLTENARQRFIDLAESKDEDYSSLARDAGVTRNAMKNIVTGETDKIALSTVELFCANRGLDFAEFIGFSGTESAALDEGLMTAVIASAMYGVGLERATASLAAQAVLRSYRVAQRHGVKPEETRSLDAITDSAREQ